MTARKAAGLEPEPSNEACVTALTPNPLEQRIRALEEVLREIADDPHQQYGSADAYSMGVADGHKCAANKARAALAPQDAQGRQN